MWEKRKLLIWGTTYPEFSKGYYETVCTGAIDGESGRLVRIYPVTLRYLENRFALYQWIEAEVERNTSDFRPESFKIKQDTIKLLDKIATKKKGGWAERAQWVLRPENVFRSVLALQTAEARDHTSLGLVKPREIVKVYAERLGEEARKEWDDHREQALKQRDLFVDAESETRDLQFVPIQYRIRFVCDDDRCKTVHDFSVRDWGIYVLHRRQFAVHGPVRAESDVIDKIRECLDPATKDAYLFLGNTKSYCQSFMVVGLFYPPKTPAAPEKKQLDLLG